MTTNIQQGTLLDVLKKKMRQTKEEMEKYKDECEEYQKRLQGETIRREEVSWVFFLSFSLSRFFWILTRIRTKQRFVTDCYDFSVFVFLFLMCLYSLVSTMMTFSSTYTSIIIFFSGETVKCFEWVLNFARKKIDCNQSIVRACATLIISYILAFLWWTEKHKFITWSESDGRLCVVATNEIFDSGLNSMKYSIQYAFVWVILRTTKP